MSDKNLLFLDDEVNILKSLERVFFDEDFEIETFTEGEEALEYLKDNPVELIISDQRMPGMTGSEFCAKAREIRPDAIRMILTGYADLEAAVEAINDGQIYKFMFKPWNDDELRATVLRALDYYDLTQENEQLLAEVMKKNAELEDFNKTLAQKVKERTALIVQKNLELGRVNKALEKSLVSTVKVIINLTQQINSTLSQHSRRVASISTEIAKLMGLNEKQIQDIEIAALVHDIGKLGIPGYVLEKDSDKLTEQEHAIMREHALFGQNVINEVDSFAHVGAIVRAHHERWDGRGHPDGLSGEQIPVEARVITVANEYDNLLTDNQERSQTFIEKFFRTNAGSQFDPKASEAMLSFIRQRMGEPESARVLDVMPHELKPGMTLAKNLQTEKGIFLLPEGQVLKDSHIRSILDIHRIDPVAGAIRVYPAPAETQ